MACAYQSLIGETPKGLRIEKHPHLRLWHPACGGPGAGCVPSTNSLVWNLSLPAILLLTRRHFSRFVVRELPGVIAQKIRSDRATHRLRGRKNSIDDHPSSSSSHPLSRSHHLLFEILICHCLIAWIVYRFCQSLAKSYIFFYHFSYEGLQSLLSGNLCRDSLSFIQLCSQSFIFRPMVTFTWSKSWRSVCSWI